MKSKTNLITEDYDGSAFSFTEDGWFNATNAAERFRKNPHEWIRLPATQEYLTALNRRYGKIPYVKTSKARADRGGGTWLHPKLAVRFTQWLDIEFAVWCDEQIDALIRQTHPVYDWKRIRHEATSSFRVMCDMVKLSREEEGKETASHHYSNEARLVNWAMTGEFGPVDRDGLSLSELSMLAKLEERNTFMIGRGVDYRLRKARLDTMAKALAVREIARSDDQINQT